MKILIVKMDELEGKKVRIITVQEEELYGSGYIGIVEEVQKRYWEKGHYEVYEIKINLNGYEEHNKKHDSHEFDGGKSYIETDFYDNYVKYNICTKYNKYELEFEEDKEETFFEILETNSEKEKEKRKRKNRIQRPKKQIKNRKKGKK